MYGASSPIFDTPGLPSLRRMKPLPKRRRTSDTASHEDVLSEVSLPNLLPADGTPDASTQGFEDALTMQLTLPSYYKSLLSDVKDILKQGMDGRSPASFDLKEAVLGGRGARGFEDDGSEGDYVDHLQQPGNTKKRKVPANLASTAHGQDAGSGQSGGEDEPTDRAIPTGRPESEYDSVPPRSQGSLQGMSLRRKGRLTKAMVAGIQHKEMLKNRKRQLAAVLGALTHGDTLALDQALSANYPFTGGLTGDQDPPRVRLSRRRAAVLARAFKTFERMYPEPQDAFPFPESEFAYVCPSATSERLKATKKEVAALHSRFEAELKRQAARAAEVARQTSAVLTGGAPTARKSKQGRISSGAKEPKEAGIEQNALGTPSSKNKKKKRSARANASNPHHLRNYIPSRLPHSGQPNATLSEQTLINPLPLRFLSTDIPPRRQKKSPVIPVSSLNNPIEEWICPFCEYDLFYGNDDSYRLAINNRKKILKRRRRARERAAAAASGVKPSTTPAPNASSTTDDADADAEFETSYPPEPVSATPKQKNSRSGSDDRGGANTTNTALG